MNNLRIEPIPDVPHDPRGMSDDLRRIREILQKTVTTFTDDWEKALPLVTVSEISHAPGILTFYTLAKQRTGSFKFFYEMLSRWLIPGKTLPLSSLFVADFRLPEKSKESFTVCAVSFPIVTEEEREEITLHFPILQIEIGIGMQSSFYARRILEIRGLFPEDKTALIHAHMANIVHRLPQHFGPDLLTEMQHFLVVCRDDFKKRRSRQHLSRLISIHYLFQRGKNEVESEKRAKRPIRLKVFRAQLNNGAGYLPVVGIFLGLRFLHDREIFEEPHLIKAIRQILPDIETVPDSFLFHRKPGEQTCTLYLEIQKKQGISGDEIKKLRQELPHEIETRVEHLHQPIFMPRNEEEIMRNMLSLSEQIRFVRDIPQVFLTFDEQSDSSLFFTVICVRVLRKQERSLQQLFRMRKSTVEYIHDRTRVMGMLRKKYPKEATVFRLRLQKELFLREDHSIDLYRARRFVVHELHRILGSIRDFNGGMISKETKTFSNFLSLFEKEEMVDHLLLENFFHSITPPVMRTLVNPINLKSLFSLLTEAIKQETPSLERYLVQVASEEESLYCIIRGPSFTVKEELQHTLERIGLQPTDVAFTEVKIAEIYFIGCLVRCANVAQQREVLACVEEEAEKASIRLRAQKQELVTETLGQRFFLKDSQKK